jgi:hypothetical protein
MKQNLISSCKTLYNKCQMFLEMWGFFGVKGIKDHIIRFLKFGVTTTKFGQL